MEHFRDVSSEEILTFVDHGASFECKGDVLTHTFNCPHCDGLVQVADADVNCSIFRHGQYNGDERNGNLKWQQMNPHESEAATKHLVDNNLIIGCGKPIMMSPDKKKVKSCPFL